MRIADIKEGTRRNAEENSKEDLHFRLPAVDRAMSVLEVLAACRGGLTLSELSRKLNIPKSSAHYLIYTLSTRGYLQRATNGRHTLGLRFTDMANASMAEQTLNVLATPCLWQVVAKAGLTAIVSVLSGAEALIIACANASQNEGGRTCVGRHLDLHCTAQGKSLIATLPEEKLNALFRGRELAQFTSKTITSFAVLKAHLEEVRSHGFAVNDEEQVQGIRAVAAPVLNPFGVVVASVSVRGSAQQIPNFRVPELGGEMIRASRDLSRQLAGS